MHGYDGWLWPMWGLMMLFWLGLAVLVVWLVVRFARPRSTGEDANGAARRILAERYARGEMGTDEYTHRLENLR